MRNDTIPTEQRIINKIRQKVEFTFPSNAMIPDCEPVRLHRSFNPSKDYDMEYEHVYKYVKDPDAVLVGVHHLGGDYEVLLYKPII